MSENKELHPWAAMLSPGEGNNVVVARALLSEWAKEREARNTEIARLQGALEGLLTEHVNLFRASLPHANEGETNRFAENSAAVQAARAALMQP